MGPFAHRKEIDFYEGFGYFYKNNWNLNLFPS